MQVKISAPRTVLALISPLRLLLGKFLTREQPHAAGWENETIPNMYIFSPFSRKIVSNICFNIQYTWCLMMVNVKTSKWLLFVTIKRKCKTLLWLMWLQAIDLHKDPVSRHLHGFVLNRYLRGEDTITRRCYCRDFCRTDVHPTLTPLAGYRSNASRQ